MKPITKTIIFVVVAFIIVILITVVKSNRVEAPVTTSPSPVATQSPAVTSYTLADVAKHKTSTDCWTAVGGNVFDLTPFVSKHPGGVPNISKVCGVDGTALFTAQHGTNQNAQAALASLKIGILK
jgi:cytochrome b involved in lipid metabolism